MDVERGFINTVDVIIWNVRLRLFHLNFIVVADGAFTKVHNACMSFVGSVLLTTRSFV